MAKVKKPKSATTLEGATARAIPPAHELERAVLRCMRWEDQFYDSGASIAERVGALVPRVEPAAVDVSGSMDGAMSDKSEMRRIDAAYGLAVLARDVCEHASISTFSNEVKKIPARRGFALKDAIIGSQSHSGAELGKVISAADEIGAVDRLHRQAIRRSGSGPKKWARLYG